MSKIIDGKMFKTFFSMFVDILVFNEIVLSVSIDLNNTFWIEKTGDTDCRVPGSVLPVEEDCGSFYWCKEKNKMLITCRLPFTFDPTSAPVDENDYGYCQTVSSDCARELPQKPENCQEEAAIDESICNMITEEGIHLLPYPDTSRCDLFVVCTYLKGDYTVSVHRCQEGYKFIMPDDDISEKVCWNKDIFGDCGGAIGEIVHHTLCYCTADALVNDFEAHPLLCNRYYSCKAEPGITLLGKHEYECPEGYGFNPQSIVDKTLFPCGEGLCDGTGTTEPPTTPEPPTEPENVGGTIIKETNSTCSPDQRVVPHTTNCLWYYLCVERVGEDGKYDHWWDLYECPTGWGFNVDSLSDLNVLFCTRGVCPVGGFDCTKVDLKNSQKFQNPHNCHQFWRCQYNENQGTWEAELNDCPDGQYFNEDCKGCGIFAECPNLH